MTAERDVTRVVRSWLRQDEHDSADQILENVLASLDATPQRRPLWPVRRIAEMSTYAKLGAAAAAVFALVVVGGAMMLRGGLGPGATVEPSALPTAAAPTGTAPVPTTTATQAASLPGEFSACVPANSEFKAGIDSQDVVSGADGDVTIDRRRGFTWSGTITATDTRFAGTHYYSFDADAYTLASGGEGQLAWAEGHRIENDGGAWLGSASGIALPDGTNAVGPAVMIGEGGYQGLTAVLIGADGPCFFNFRGIVTEIPDPPVPFTGG